MKPKMPKLSLSLSKNEKRLLGILLFCLIGAGFYYYYYQPSSDKIIELEQQISDKEAEHQSLLARAGQKVEYENKIKAFKFAISKLSPKFYGDLTQEEVMLIAHEMISKAELDANSYSFSEDSSNLGDKISSLVDDSNMTDEEREEFNQRLNVDENFLLDTVENKRVNINFEGGYPKIRAFFMNLDEQEKYASIENITMSSTDGEKISGTMELNIFNLPSIQEIVSADYSGEFFQEASTREVYENFFAPYQLYKEAQVKQALTNTTDSSVTSTGGMNVPIPEPVFPDLTSSEPTEHVETITVLNSFEQLNCYFAPNDINIKGSVAKVTAGPNGNALRLQYRFDDFNRRNEASIVFREKAVMQDIPAAKLRVDVNFEIPTNNLLKITLIGANAKQYELELNGEASSDWTHYYADIPADIKYPFMVRRIYVQSKDMQQKLEGSILFDNLGVVD